MNIQTTQLKSQKKQIKEHSDWAVYCGVIVKLIIVLLAVFAVANSYTYLNQQIQSIERDNIKLSRKIEDIDREIKHLQNKYENASSWPKISKQIARFNLKLREPDHSQIHYITLNDGKAYNDSVAEQDFDRKNNRGPANQVADIETYNKR